MRGGERLGVPRQLVEAEEFSSQGRFNPCATGAGWRDQPASPALRHCL
jgi:hypothetical protein